MTSLEGGRLSAGRDVTREGPSAVRSPGGRGQAESPVPSRAGGGARACQRSRIKTSGRPAFSLLLGSVSLAPRARGARAAASLGWPRAGSRKPGWARRPGWRGAGRAARRALKETPAHSLHSPRPGAGCPERPRRGEPPSLTPDTWTLPTCPTPKTVKAAAKTSAPTAAGTSRKMEPGPWQRRARRARRPGGPWRRRPAAERRQRARRAPGARRAPEARGLAPPTPRPPRGLQPRATPRTVRRGWRGERQLPPRRGRRGGWALGGAGDAWTMRVRKCSPRPSAPPWLPLPGPHA